jgi:hypothetical protein
VLNKCLLMQYFGDWAHASGYPDQVSNPIRVYARIAGDPGQVARGGPGRSNQDRHGADVARPSPNGKLLSQIREITQDSLKVKIVHPKTLYAIKKPPG